MTLLTGPIFCLVLAMWAGHDGTQVSFEEFKRFLEPKLPTSGAVEAVYVGRNGYGSFNVGYDIRTGAWYSADFERVVGQDQRGRIFGGEAKTGKVGYVTDNPFPLTDERVEDYFPFVLLRGLLGHPEVFRSIERTPEGGHLLRVELPGGRRSFLDKPDAAWADPTPVPVWVEVDGEGRVIRRWLKVGEKMEPYQFADERDSYQYAEETPPGFTVRTGVDPDDRYILESVEFHDGAEPAVFAMDRVRSLGLRNVARRDTAMRGGPELGPFVDGSPTTNSGAPLAAIPPDRPAYVFPLAATGSVLIALGIYAWWRRW